MISVFLIPSSIPSTSALKDAFFENKLFGSNIDYERQQQIPLDLDVRIAIKQGYLQEQRRRKRWQRNCENNGTFVNGKCECRYPYTGPRCADFSCEHGLSVGPRYDPESTFFNRKCICDEDWAGELCNIPIADQCNERGQYIRGRCKCHGYYFGPKCQYVGKCVNGKLQAGMCMCNYGFEGDYCDKIVCHHGYPDKTTNSETCVCPPRHSGTFCDECLLTGLHILPFPNCTEDHVPYHARLSRERTDSLIFSRLMVLFGTIALIVLFAAAMYILHWGRNRSDPTKEFHRRRIAEERKEVLKRAIFPPEMPLVIMNNNSLTISGRRDSRRPSIPEWNERLDF